MGCPTYCARTCGGLCILLGLSVLVVIGILFPTVMAPLIVMEAVNGVVIFEVADLENKTEKWNSFVGGADDPDLLATYGEDDGSQSYYYVYNLTNPKDFLENGARPHVTEVGPFGYARLSRKYDLKFTKVDVVSFKTFSFDKRIQPISCLEGQELIGHPDPKMCMDPMTEMTIFNSGFSQTMRSVDLGYLLSIFGAQAIQQIYISTNKMIINNLSANVLPTLYKAYYRRFIANSAVRIAEGSFDTEMTVTLNITLMEIATLLNNDITAANHVNSPFSKILQSLTTDGKTTDHVFKTDAQMTTFLNQSDSFSPFSEVGHFTWYAATYDQARHAFLVSKCEVDGTTECASRVSSILVWLYSSTSGWSSKPATISRAHRDYVFGPTPFRCDGFNICYWKQQHFNGRGFFSISANTMVTLFSEADSPISFMHSKNYQLWRNVYKKCIGIPALMCKEVQPYKDAYGVALTEFVAVNEQASLISEMKTNSTFADEISQKYEGQICSVAKMNFYHSGDFRNPFFRRKISENLRVTIGKLYTDDPNLSANISDVSAITALQFGTSKYSSLVYGRPTISSPTGFKTEFHWWLGQHLSILDTQKIFNIVMNATAMRLLIKVAFTTELPTDVADLYYPKDFRVNLNADYSKNFTEGDAEMFSRINEDKNMTIGGGLAKMLMAYGKYYAFGQEGLFCNDKDDCSMDKGGYFVKMPVEQYLYHGFSDAATMYLSKLLRKDRNATISCMKQKVFFYDKTTGYLEDENATHIVRRSPTDCSPQRDHDCTDSGIHVRTRRWNVTDDTEMYLEKNWTRFTTDKTKLSEYYNITRDFRIDGVVISNILPVYANKLGSMHRDIEFQKAFACFTNDDTCRVEINTGSLNLTRIGQIESIFGMNTSYKWKSKKPYEGTLTGQFPPRYLDGMNAEDCPIENRVFEPTHDGSVFYALKERTTIDYTNDAESAISVCRYSMSAESYDKTIANFEAEPHLFPPRGFLPLITSINAMEAYHTAVGPPSFYWDSILNDGKELAKFDGLTPDAARHSSFKDIEQSTGAPFRTVTRLSTYVRLERSVMFPNLRERYYMFPSIATEVGMSIPTDLAQATGRYINVFKKLPATVMGIGIGAGTVCVIIGICLCSRSRAHVKPQ